MSDTAVVEAPTTTTLLTDATPTTPEGTTSEPTDATAAPEAAPTEAAPAAPVYEFVAPEGVTYDANMIEQATPLLAEANVPPEIAQKLVGVVAASIAAQEQARADAVAQQVQAWADATKADPEIGGARLPETIAMAQRAIHRFGGDDIKELLDSTGLGNHPAVAKMFAAIGRATAEDTAIRSATGSLPPQMGAADKLYPSMRQES